jgi:hypothetical protein
MKPDGLKQALDRQVVFVAQGIHGPHTRTPGGIKVSGRRKHLEIAFAPMKAQSQVNADKIERIQSRICLFIETGHCFAASFCWPKSCFSD